MHPDTPNSLLYPPSGASSTSSSSSGVIAPGQLSRWAVVSVERDEEDYDRKNHIFRGNNNNKGTTTSSSSLLTVSLPTWTYLQLTSLISILSRNDVGVNNYELVSTLHAEKDLEPMWRDLRRMSGMHPQPWPVDPRLLWYPGWK